MIVVNSVGKKNRTNKQTNKQTLNVMVCRTRTTNITNLVDRSKLFLKSLVPSDTSFLLEHLGSALRVCC